MDFQESSETKDKQVKRVDQGDPSRMVFWSRVESPMDDAGYLRSKQIKESFGHQISPPRLKTEFRQSGTIRNNSFKSEWTTFDRFL